MADSGHHGSQDDVVTFMYVPGQTGSIRRVHVPRSYLRRSGAAAIALSVAWLVLGVDYVRARLDLSELDHLRNLSTEQQDQLDDYERRVETVSDQLARIDGLERKIRIITNLEPADPLPLPGVGGTDGELVGAEDLSWLTRRGRDERIRASLAKLSEAAGTQEETLAKLIAHLEDQSARLVHTPSIVPVKGWVTSQFGYRTSPFTNNREFHKGLDIAGRANSPIVAPADATVRDAGRKRALGNYVVLKHGYGVETVYGHLNEALVEKGQKVKRGDKLGLMGSTGRSTGPHLHYGVLVNGKPVNPRNYILD